LLALLGLLIIRGVKHLVMCFIFTGSVVTCTYSVVIPLLEPLILVPFPFPIAIGDFFTGILLGVVWLNCLLAAEPSGCLLLGTRLTMSEIARVTQWTRAKYTLDFHRRWIVSMSTLLFMGLTYIGFNLGRLLYCFLAALCLFKFFFILRQSLCLNLLFSSSCPWHVNSARVGRTIGTEGKWKWYLGGHDDWFKGCKRTLFLFLSFDQNVITRYC